MLFGKPKKNIEPNLSAQVDSDLVVRNMPRPQISSSLGYKANASAGFTPPAAAPQKHKLVGLLVMAGGLIFIGALVYLSYYFIVKPATRPASPTVAVNQTGTTTKNNATPTSSPVNPSEVIKVISSSTPEIISESASSSASSSLMNEELKGRDGRNLPPLIDSDSDGLNDNEEALLGSSPSTNDSNNNGYQDLVEINNNYNPADSGRLSANQNLALYENKTYNYEVLYPKNWTLKTLNDDATLVFTADDDSIVQISLQDNPDKQSILTWYNATFPNVTVTYDKLKNASTWNGVSGVDDLNFYLTDKNKNNLYVFSYIPAVDGRLVYPNIFKLIINSLVIK